MVQDVYESMQVKLRDRRLKIRPMCNEIGVSYQTVYNIINGRTKSPDIETMDKIFAYLVKTNG